MEFGNPIRSIFPVFEGARDQQGRALAFLDSAASSQKPQVVIDRLTHFLRYEHANIHRGAYRLSAEATEAYEQARDKVAQFLGAPEARQVIFTKGTTEAVNLVSHSLQRMFKPGDVILISLLEHHSNLVPWQILAERVGARVEFAKLLPDASLDKEDFLSKLRSLKPKLVALSHVSNAFGTILPVVELGAEVKKSGAYFFIDGAQAVPHQRIDVKEIGCDFYAFSGHKVYGPTGIGALYASSRALENMHPFQAGGGMIQSVTVEGTTFAEAPQKFEAGTPPIAEAVALGTAIDFVESLGWEKLHRYEEKLFDAGWNLISKEKGVTLYGPKTNGKPQASIIAFNVEGIHPHDFATVADSFNVQVRAGHHCAMPALQFLGLQATVRASLGVYSDTSDFEALVESIREARKLFS